MNLIWTRRISQAFFLLLFIWFSLAATLGDAWWQLSGWPVNWFQELDPLLALASLLSSGTLYGNLWWALVTLGLTLLLGRFFCGWVCPFGALHHFIGWLGQRGLRGKAKIAAHRPHPAQALKYYILLFMLSAASGGLLARLLNSQWPDHRLSLVLLLAGLAALIILVLWSLAKSSPKRLLALAVWAALWLLASWLLFSPRGIGASMQSGLLDPISLLHRSVNLVLLPLVEPAGLGISGQVRWFQGAWLIGLIFITALLLNLMRPRFYCRFICPLGALLGVLARLAPLRMGKARHPCSDCRLCETACQGACAPPDEISPGECHLCLNCRQVCPDRVMGYGPAPSASGEMRGLDLNRRRLVLTLFGGLATAPLLRLGGAAAARPDPLRPPGSLPEAEFLARCTKCGQCMRICPSGVIQPALNEAGLEGFWTPVMDFRMSQGGCLKDCVGCGHLCPTAAIRPLSLAERRGQGEFAQTGPVRIGTAFIKRGRCLPWAMDRPCIVCQEMCPVSPKAITTVEEYRVLGGASYKVLSFDSPLLRLKGGAFNPGGLAGGDYFLGQPGKALRAVIGDNGPDWLKLARLPDSMGLGPEQEVQILVRLQKPRVDPARCIGCGACEHACPVSASPAIAVSPENASRSRKGALLAGS
jgi:ferredoxin